MEGRCKMERVTGSITESEPSAPRKFFSSTPIVSGHETTVQVPLTWLTAISSDSKTFLSTSC